MQFTKAGQGVMILGEVKILEEAMRYREGSLWESKRYTGCILWLKSYLDNNVVQLKVVQTNKSTVYPLKKIIEKGDWYIEKYLKPVCKLRLEELRRFE